MTEIGAAFHAQCRIAVAAAERAEAIVAASLSEPRGTVRFACPTARSRSSRPCCALLTLYPKGNLHIVAADRPVDLINERIDVALRVRTRLDSDVELTMRTLARSRRILVASPALANQLAGKGIDALAGAPTLSSSGDEGTVTWRLEGPDGTQQAIVHHPRLSCGDFEAIRRAATADLGVALLPDHACMADLRSGALMRVFPDWRGQEGIVHLMFTTRTGLPPLVRAWIDHLAGYFGGAGVFSR